MYWKIKCLPREKLRIHWNYIFISTQIRLSEWRQFSHILHEAWREVLVYTLSETLHLKITH